MSNQWLGHTVKVGIDGNCGYALIGANLQEGEAEFVEVEDMNDTESQRKAAWEAYKKLCARLDLGNRKWDADESLPPHKHTWTLPDMYIAQCTTCGDTKEA